MSAYDVGLLVLRVVFGLTLAAHGYNKFFGGGRIPGTAAWFDSIGMRPGVLHARLAAGAELAAGIGLALGMLTSLCAAAFVALMIVAGWTVHRDRGFFIVGDGWEYNLVLAAGAAGVATLGPGRISVDHLLFGNGFLDGWAGLGISIAGGVIGAVVQLGVFYRPSVRAAAANE